MQRNSGGSQRIIILVAIVAVLFVGVLYFMKRAEANRLSGALDSLQVPTMDTVYSLTLFVNCPVVRTRTDTALACITVGILVISGTWWTCTCICTYNCTSYTNA